MFTKKSAATPVKVTSPTGVTETGPDVGNRTRRGLVSSLLARVPIASSIYFLFLSGIIVTDIVIVDGASDNSYS